jgi:hypothetical protein
MQLFKYPSYVKAISCRSKNYRKAHRPYFGDFKLYFFILL